MSPRGNNLETMFVSRRNFIAGGAALAAAPALGAPSASGDTDVVIVGAGAAGIAAARKIAAAGRRFALIEASDHAGGRCVTDNAAFGVPFDRGAHWVHLPDINPVARLAARSGIEIYPAPPGQKLRIGKRNAREGEMEDYLATLVRANRAIQEAARGKADVACMQALPKDLGDWRPAVEFALGPFACSKGLEDVSAMDFARSLERDVDAFCRQGFGALLAKLASDLPVQLNVGVQRVLSTRNSVEIETTRGRIIARAAIVTVSTGVLGTDKIRFDPALPPRHRDAITRLSLGSYDHIALELKGNPLQLQNDDLVLEKSSGTRTAALLANVSGTPLCMVEVAGKFGAELARQGQAAMVDFATGWLADLYGADIKKAVGRTATTAWSRDPFVLGAFSAAAPGGQPGRRVLMEPVRDRLFFAGEAVHETLWGTVGGAWESGERAADAALRLWVGAPSAPARRR
ncbi:MAG: NAD(P)/FAD-dependent oxidoreductase [Alphaproteobacteria bacterium]